MGFDAGFLIQGESLEGAVIRVVADILPAVSGADPDSAYFKLSDDTLWKIEYDPVAATDRIN